MIAKSDSVLDEEDTVSTLCEYQSVNISHHELALALVMSACAAAEAAGSVSGDSTEHE